jgi:hypothetical protein
VQHTDEVSLRVSDLASQGMLAFRDHSFYDAPARALDFLERSVQVGDAHVHHDAVPALLRGGIAPILDFDDPGHEDGRRSQEHGELVGGVLRFTSVVVLPTKDRLVERLGAGYVGGWNRDPGGRAERGGRPFLFHRRGLGGFVGGGRRHFKQHQAQDRVAGCRNSKVSEG